jgi:hypothetical protein
VCVLVCGPGEKKADVVLAHKHTRLLHTQ